jgi:hypothetical protein
MDCPGRHAIGLSKYLDGDTPVIGDLGGDIEDESQIAGLPFAVEDPLVSCLFPLLNFSNNLVQLRLLKGLVPVDLFLEWFPSDSKSANEIADWPHNVLQRG